MKAIQYSAYGKSEVIKMNEIEKPVPKENEILIKVHAASINPMDIKIRSGLMQKQIPTKFPFTPGLDVAGTVESTGSQVSRLKKGDKVFATTFGGTYAEYVALDAEKAALMPENVNMKQAAALAVPLVTSYTFLVQQAELKSGQKILIHGAAGGVGSVMVQMAKTLSAYIIATATGNGIQIAKSAGADEVIDYKYEDFTKRVKDLDIVFDLVGGETQTKSFKVIRDGGRLFSTVMPPSQELASQHHVVAKFASSEPSSKKLEYGKRLVEEEKIKPQNIKSLKLEEAAKAQDMLSAGGVDGKIVLIMEQETFH